MRKLIITGTAIAMLAVPAASMAAAPDGNYTGSLKDGVTTSLSHQVTPDNASLVGELSARSIQNGQFISGNDGTYDQTTIPGSRAALIQGYLGH